MRSLEISVNSYIYFTYLIHHPCCIIIKTKAKRDLFSSEIVGVLPDMVSLLLLLLHCVTWPGRWIVEDRRLQEHLDLGAVLHGDTESVNGLLLGPMMSSSSNPLVLPLPVLFLSDLLGEWSECFLNWLLDRLLEVFHLFADILERDNFDLAVLSLHSPLLLHFVVVLLLDPEEDLRQVEFPYAEIRL